MSVRLYLNENLFGEVNTAIWREKAQLEIGEGTYQLYREGKLSGDFVLEHNVSPLTRRFGLFDGERQLGSIYPLGILTRRSNIDLPNEWPLPIRVFVFWLAFIIWRRQNAAAS